MFRVPKYLDQSTTMDNVCRVFDTYDMKRGVKIESLIDQLAVSVIGAVQSSRPSRFNRCFQQKAALSDLFEQNEYRKTSKIYQVCKHYIEWFEAEEDYHEDDFNEYFLTQLPEIQQLLDTHQTDEDIIRLMLLRMIVDHVVEKSKAF